MKKLSECTVLIVDDTEENVDILVEALGDDYELSVAMDGKSVLEYIKFNTPDIILLDIMMPGISGYEVCSQLKANPVTEEIPIIFLSAMTDIESKKRGFELGAVDYITKPFNVYEVQARVNTHLSLMLVKHELSMQNVILEKKVTERTQELALTQETTIEAIAYLVEYRDPETGGHIKRTKNYVRILAKKLQENPKFTAMLSDDVIDNLYKSAPLHDIGKVGISDSVLLKTGKLTDEEFDEMKRHTMIGYEALFQAAQKLGENSFLENAMTLSRYHHEKWNGKGYPEHIHGEDIPIAGRIMAVSDVYDALISKRVYKPAFSHEKAVQIIAGESGKHFDPDIVEAFLQVSDQFHEIALMFSDSDEAEIPASKAQ